MPVPYKQDFGLADDAATTAKRMQNGAAVEANLSRGPEPIGRRRPDRWLQSFWQPRPGRHGPNRCPGKSLKTPLGLPVPISCRGNVLWLHPMPAGDVHCAGRRHAANVARCRIWTAPSKAR